MKLRRLIVIILTVCMIVTYTPISAFADSYTNDDSSPGETAEQNINGAQDNDDSASETEADEGELILEDSGLTYDTVRYDDDTIVQTFYSYPVRYEDDNGEFVEIEPELIETDSKDTRVPSGYAYENKAGEYKTYIPSELSSDTPILLENDKYTFTMAPASLDVTDAQVLVEDVKATYGSDEDEIKFEYISQNDGIKENIILNERPSSNEITFKLTFDNMTYSLNPTDNGITFYNEETDEIVMGIESPFMNDDTGEAYSEDLEYEMIDPEEGENVYTLKLKISDKYLDDPDRVYPVTIDPTATWVGTSEMRDSYVLSNSPSTNFYSSSATTMLSGTNTQGTRRTYIHILNLKSELIGANISSATFDIYETGGGLSGKNVRIYRITEDWTNSSVTWNNKPDIASGFIDSITTNGTANHKMSYDVTSWAQKVVSESVHNYGLCLRNKTESGSTYTEFYGTRTGTTSKRPKLTVVYTDDKPTQATKLRTDSPYAEGSKVYVRWEGVTANKLQCIQYKIAKLNAAGEITDSNYVSYTSIGSAASSGRHSIPNSANFPKGYYRVYIRGLSKQGITGKYNSVKFRIEDKPTKPSSVTVSPNSIYTGDSLTVSWAGLTGSFLSKAEYKIVKLNPSGGISNSKYVPYTTLKTSPSSSGSATISGKIKDAGTYKVYVRGVNSSGIVGEARESGTITVTKDDAPDIGSITLSKGNDTIDQEEYIKSGNISVSVTGITDDRSLNSVTGPYRLLKNGNVVDSGSNITLTQSGSSYSASFNISQSVFEASGDYTVEFSLTDIGGNTGTDTADLHIDDEAPTADIELLDLPQEGMLNIPFYAQDKHSGIDTIDLKLYHGSSDDLGQFVMDLANNITDEKTVTLNAGTLTNGPYTLKLTATDNAGNTAELYRDFEVYNRVGKPEITVDALNSSGLRVNWNFSQTPSDLDHIEYSLNGGNWVSVNNSNTAQGYFTVSVTGLSGTNYIRVRGVDSNSVAGDASRKDFNMDTTPPAVSLSSVINGILSGSVTDTNLLKWELFIKETNANDITYIKINEGTNGVSDDRICFVDLSGGTYTGNTSYTLKLKATDRAGNAADDTISFIYSPSGMTASFMGTSDRVKRFLGQSYSTDSFLVSLNDDNEVTLDISGDTELSNISWYLNNSFIGTGRTLAYELTGTELTGSNDIFFTAEDSLGNKVLSRDLYIDSDEDIIEFGTPYSRRIEQEVELSKEAVAIRLDVPDDPDITYSVQVGNSQFTEVLPGELVYISELDSDIVKTDTFTLLTEGPQRSLVNLTDFGVLSSLCPEETFTVTTSQMEAYWPHGVRAIDKINYKTYLYWDVPENLPDNISYEVHRSTEENFDPSINTLVAEDIREGYWCDINVNYEVDLYYKVRAVSKNHNGQITDGSSYTECRMSSAISENEYFKHLGHKDYWGYAEVDTPNGTGYIEKFDGNFFYSTSDASVPNESLPVSFTRSYNSESTSRSSLGYGWTHNYDMELLKVGDDENADNSTLALRDGQGTIYTFSKVNGIYVSSMGKYLTLKEETTDHSYSIPSGNSTEQFSIDSSYTMFSRDGMKLYFDENGKLLLIEEANSNILIFGYDPERGLLEKITTGRGINIDFIYYDGDNGSDPLTLKEMRLPDGSKTVYGYTSGSRLNSVKNYPVNPANQNDCITYNYTYSNKKMVGLTDGSGNAYNLSYGTDPRTVTFTYPAIQNQAAEGMRVTVGNTTITERLIGGSPVTREEDFFDSFGQVIEHRTYTGNEYVSETYSYVNNLIATETTKQVYDILELSDDGTSGTITKAEKDVTVEHHYDGNDNSTNDSYDTINDKISEVEYAYASNGTTEWNKYLPVETTETIDGVVVSHEESEYDAAGNLTESKDYISKEITDYGYADGTGSAPKGTLVSEENWLMNANGQKAGLISSMETTVSYSGTNKIETVTKDAGDDRTVEETTYDQMGRVTQRTVYTYTDYGKTSQKISRESHLYTYDGYGREIAETTTTSEVTSGLVDISGAVVTKSSAQSYYPNGALASETDERGVTSSYSYDVLNRLVSATVSKGGQTQITTTSYNYGPVTIHDGKGGTLSYSNCLITTEFDGNLEIHKTYQDGQGRVVREINDGVITDYSYDLNGNRVIEFLVTEKAQDIQDEEGITTYTLYNEEGTAYGSVIEPAWENDRFIITEDSIVEVNYFDDRGNISGSRDPLGNITVFGYDQENRLTSVTLPDTDTNVTTFSYSESSNNSGDYTSTVTMTDALGARSVEVSDASGNTVSISDNGKQSENISPIVSLFKYDGAGRVTKETKTSGEYITYSYDSSGRLTERSEFTNSNTELTRTVYTYVGTTENILSMSDYRIESGSPVLYHYEEYGYDNLGRMVSKAEIKGDSVPSELTPYTVSYSYDIHDNITGIAYGSAIPTEISSINYTYSGEILTAVSAEINNTEYLLKEYTYTDWGAVDTVKDYYDFKNSGTSKYILLNYGYDRLTNLSEMVYTKEDDTVIECHYYSYDKAGKIITEENYSSLNDLNEIRRFEYDSLGRLVLSDIKDIVEESGNTSEENKLITEYSYDKVGNRLTKTENGEETAYVYNGLNQLLTETKGTDTLTYSYDSNGNQTGVTGTSDGETVSKIMTYTPGGMMETYSDGERVQENTYIGGETRIKKAEGPSLQNLTDITNYFYQEGSVLYTTGNDNEAKSFNLLNISDIFATEREGENTEDYYFYLNDIRGSKTELIDNAAGNIVFYWYNDFGEVSEERNEDFEDFVNEVQYTGAIYDGSTGLLYLNARFYDPSTGRFTSQDSYRGEKDEPDTWHLYAYCANDPINKVDPVGNFALAIPFIAGITISMEVVIGVAVVVGAFALGTWYANYRSNKKKGDEYKISVHGPQKYCGYSGIVGMIKRWKDMKCSTNKKIRQFALHHQWRYHLHLDLYRNGVFVKHVFTL